MRIVVFKVLIFRIGHLSVIVTTLFTIHYSLNQLIFAMEALK